jgi:hypothetical protein
VRQWVWRSWLVVGATASLLASSCQGHVTRGRYLYREGRYMESAELLASYERDLSKEPPKQQAEYATYRGLSNLVIGNMAEAQRWMGFAYELERRFPGSLRPECRLELDQGWWELTRHLGPIPATQIPANAHAVTP